MFLFVTQASWIFILRNDFMVWSLGLFEINKWVPIKRGAVWFNSFKSLKNDKC